MSDKGSYATDKKLTRDIILCDLIPDNSFPLKASISSWLTKGMEHNLSVGQYIAFLFSTTIF